MLSKVSAVTSSSIASHENYGLPRWFSGKESACNVGDMGLILGLGRSLREGNGKPLQYSCLQNSTDRGTWQAIVQGGHKRVGYNLVTKQQ